MFLPLTEEYIANKFFQNCGKPYYNRAQRTYQGSCPICREGKSWLKKRRCYYIVEKNVICCHNCGWYSNPYKWIGKVTGLDFKQIKSELESGTESIIFEYREEKKQVQETEILPSDSINLLDQEQIEYYEQNNTIKQALKLLEDRRLLQAVNRPRTFFISLTDKVHDNRLIIPFYDSNNKIVFYQTRSILNDDTRPKYLSKVKSEKSLYGINNISQNMDYVFITEGPIDAMFIQNGIAVAGINEGKNKNFTNTQSQQLNEFILHKKIWVLDNQFTDQTSKAKTKSLLECGESVFIWPESMKHYKDINEYCIDKKTNQFDTGLIVENTFNGLKGKLLLSNY